MVSLFHLRSNSFQLTFSPVPSLPDQLTCGAILTSKDILGCTVVGTITAVGGGTIRDALLGKTPIFWMLEVARLLPSLTFSQLSSFPIAPYCVPYHLCLRLCT
jgi:hypothetical protein